VGLYDGQITRTDAGPLIPEDVAKEIIQGAVTSSVCLKLLRRLPNMPRALQRMPVLNALPIAYFVSGDTGLKKTTEAAWGNKYLNAEEIACIVPIPESVLDDSAYDIWGEVKPRIVEAIGMMIDAAILFGTNAPVAWPTNIVAAATAAGNAVALGGGGPDIADDLGGVGGVMATVENDGFDVSGFIAHRSIKARLRGLRTADGDLIFQPSLTVGTPSSLYGQPIEYPDNGAWNLLQALVICGSFREAVYSIRQDLTYKILTEAVITDNAGAIVYNLPQQDMVALRTVMRLAWQVPNPINRMQPTEANRYPFAVLTP